MGSVGLRSVCVAPALNAAALGHSTNGKPHAAACRSSRKSGPLVGGGAACRGAQFFLAPLAPVYGGANAWGRGLHTERVQHLVAQAALPLDPPFPRIVGTRSGLDSKSASGSKGISPAPPPTGAQAASAAQPAKSHCAFCPCPPVKTALIMHGLTLNHTAVPNPDLSKIPSVPFHTP